MKQRLHVPLRSTVLALLVACAIGNAFAASDAPSNAALAFEKNAAPLLENYCTECHGEKRQKGNVSLAGKRNADALAEQSDLWFRVLEQLDSGKMPPKDEEQPTPEERAKIKAWIRGEYIQLLLAKQREVGRSKLRRLTRKEYANTLEDIFGIRPQVDLNLPPDGVVDGYDKASSALSLSAEGARGYLKMAEEELRWILKPLPKSTDDDSAKTVRTMAAESGESAGQTLVLQDGTKVSFNSDSSSGRFDYGAKTPGWYHVRFSVYGYQTDKPLPFGVYTGKTHAYPQEIDLAEILEAPPGKPAVLETEVYLEKGRSVRLIPFRLGVPVPKNSMANKCNAPGLAVQWMEVDEPKLPVKGDAFITGNLPPALTEELRRNDRAFFSKNPKAAYQVKSITREVFREILRRSYPRIGARLYRRDLTEAETTAFVNEAMRQSIDDETPIKSAFLSQVLEMLMSPDFLCVIEKPGRLDDAALASRLSYFLWNSPPDDQLAALAETHKLHDPPTLTKEVDRMMDDWRFGRFIQDFSDQWLGLRAIADTSPDRQLYPDYDELIRFSSTRETRRTLFSLIKWNEEISRLVKSSTAWLNEPLAQHYGVPNVSGLDMRKVTLPSGSPYGGIWTQSAIMKVTANGTNTSPVKRGVWVSERLLGIHIPPPPSDINPIQPDVRGAKTLREQLALHSKSATCAACHARFDPYGFALESFDVAGGYRVNFREIDPEFPKLSDHEKKARTSWRSGLPVDCAGRTTDGQEFSNVSELREMIANHPRQLAVGFVRHLITYSTGTPPAGEDTPAIDEIVDGAAAKGYLMRTLIQRLVASNLFQMK